MEPLPALQAHPRPPVGLAYLGPQVRGRRAQGDPAGALAAAQGHPEICSALVGDTHRAAGESFPGAPVEHGRAPAASSAVRRSVRPAAGRAGRLGGHPQRLGAWQSPPRSTGLAPLCSARLPLLSSQCLPLSRPQVPPSLPASPPPSAASPRGPPALPFARRTRSAYLLQVPASPPGPTPAHTGVCPAPKGSPLTLSQKLGNSTTSRPPAAVTGGGGMQVKYF